MRSSGSLRSEWWQFLTDVSGQPIGTIFRGVENPNPLDFVWIRYPWRWYRKVVPKRR